LKPAETSNSLDILVIEDDSDTQANLRDILELDAYHVESAFTAAQALRRKDWERFIAIVLDRQLPDATADELLPILRRTAPEAAVIIVTGYADLEGAIEALRQGAADYILKPINPDALRTSLNRITEKRRLALDKERSEAVFRNLVEAAECMIVILRPDHSVVYFSPFAERLTGYSAQEVRGRDFLTLFRLADARGRVEPAVSRILAGESGHGIEFSIVCRDGSRRWIVWNSRYLADYEGPPAIMAVGQDITSFKQAQQRALQAERLAAIGQIVAGLAHESRNALQRSQACLEMLALTIKDRPEALDLLGRLQTAQDHLHHLYEDVRGYAAPIHLERRPCSLTEIWREAWSNLEPLRQRKQAVLTESFRTLKTAVSADPFRLGQVFRNLLENAIAAGSAPVEIEILVEETTHEDQPALRVTVRDNGPGIDSEERPRIFEPFFTTKSKGTGLGLAIARRIMEAHGGQIAVGSEPQPGAVFILTIPRGFS
jgi:PAS domain S-box-containing protein